MPSVDPGTRVTAHFQWVRQLLAGEAGKTQLDGVINSIAEIQKQIDTLGPDVAGKSSLEMLSNPSFRVVTQTLRAAGQFVATVGGQARLGDCGGTRGERHQKRDGTGRGSVHATDRSRLQQPHRGKISVCERSRPTFN